MAATQDNKKIVESLLAHHADVKAKASNGMMPLHVAAYSGNRDVALSLLAHGADVDAKDNKGLTATYYATYGLPPGSEVHGEIAANNGHPEVSEMLRQHGGHYIPEIHDAARVGDIEAVKALLKDNPDLVFTKGDRGETPLLDAAFFGHREVVKLLLASNSDVNARDNSGATPLHWAVDFRYVEVADLLRQHGGNE